LEIVVSVREREQGRFKGSNERAAREQGEVSREHERAVREHEGVAREQKRRQARLQWGSLGAQHIGA